MEGLNSAFLFHSLRRSDVWKSVGFLNMSFSFLMFIEISELWGERELGLVLLATEKDKISIDRIGDPQEVKEDPPFSYN